jgi:hypothetical protein
MKKVLHIVHPQRGLNIEGSDLYVLELCELLDSLPDFETTILYTRKGGFSQLVEKKNIHTIFHDESDSSLMRNVFYLRDLLEKLEPDVVHTHGLLEMESLLQVF